MDWSVTAIFGDRPSDDVLIALAEELDGEDLWVSGARRGQFAITADVVAATPVQAGEELTARATRALDARGLAASLTGLEIYTWDEVAAMNATPNCPDVVSAPEAATILDVSRQRVHQLAATHPDFPTPLYELATGKIWTRSSIEAYARSWQRRTGRSRRTA